MFTSMFENLNSGLPRTNPAGGQSETGPSNCKSSALTARPRCLLTCLTTLLQNDDEYRCARFSILIKPVHQQIRLLTGLNVGGKTRTIAFELVEQVAPFCCPFYRSFNSPAKTVLHLLFFSGFKTS